LCLLRTKGGFPLWVPSLQEGLWWDLRLRK
jgi:hypothetical protein